MANSFCKAPPCPITVLMPVYNAEKYLADAIDSILQQTFSNFIFLIINDGSTDKSEQIILNYKDPRIQYLKNETNSGIVATMNKGLNYITSEFIIRMDADDLSTTNRFEVLFQFMKMHPEIGIFSSAVERFGNETAIWRPPLLNDDIKAHLLFGSSIIHAACIIRTKILKEHLISYRDTYPHMEDYDLWFRLKDIANFANTSYVLYKYRVASHNVTVQNAFTVNERKKKIFKWILSSIEIDATDDELLLHIGIENKAMKLNSSNIRKYKEWLNRLIEANKRMNKFPQKALIKQVEERWNRLLYYLPEYSYKSVFAYIMLSKGLNYAQLVYLLKHTINKCVVRKGNL